VDANFFSVRRLTLWPRPRATGTRRVSAPSRLAQRDVAKTWYPANLAEKFARLSLQGRDARLLAQSRKLPTHSLGGRAPDYWGGPIWRKPNTEKLLTHSTRTHGFSQRKVMDGVNINNLFSTSSDNFGIVGFAWPAITPLCFFGHEIQWIASA
jgi:hypothetical protein